MNISACIITNNNPQVLKAIESVYDSVSEIILVNTCKNFDLLTVNNMEKVKLYSFEWNDSFSDARNYSISKATGDWILIIDSDEVMSKPIKSISNDFTYYSFYTMNKAKPTMTVRLFKNNMGIGYVNNAHETVEGCNEYNSCFVNDIVFKHTGYESEETVKLKLERNLRILETDFRNRLRNYYLCNTHYGLKNKSECVEYALLTLEDDIEDCYKISVCINVIHILNINQSTNDINEIQNKIKEIENVSTTAIHF